MAKSEGVVVWLDEHPTATLPKLSHDISDIHKALSDHVAPLLPHASSAWLGIVLAHFAISDQAQADVFVDIVREHLVLNGDPRRLADLTTGYWLARSGHPGVSDSSGVARRVRHGQFTVDMCTMCGAATDDEIIGMADAFWNEGDVAATTTERPPAARRRRPSIQG